MKKSMYYGITEIEGDLFVLFSLNRKTNKHNFKKEELSKLYKLKEKEIYIVTDNIYQAPQDLDNNSLIALLNNDFIHSKDLDGLILKELI